MVERDNRWNRWVRKALWVLVAIGVAAAAPLMLHRIQMERSANTVEFVADYRDLLAIAEHKADPDAWVDEQLAAFRAAGVGAMAVYESTLEELELGGAIRTFTAKEALLMEAVAGDADGLAAGGAIGGADGRSVGGARDNRTYLLFAGEEERAALEPVIREGFAAFGIDAEPWTAAGRAGLAVGAAPREAMLLPLDPNPLALERLGSHGFRLAVRLSDARPYDYARLDALLGRLREAGAETLIFAGTQVTGYDEDKNAMALTGVAELANKHGLVIAVIEQPMAKQQKGIGKLAALSGYQTVRLHSVLEEESFQDAAVLADRYVLAVKDRNIRMIYLNPAAKVDLDLQKLEDSAHNLRASLNDKDFGAVERIRALGFAFGTPKPFDIVNPGWEKALKLLVVLGAVALIARMAAYFLPWLTLPVFAFGLAATAGLYALSATVAMQALALLAAVSAPTAAVIAGIRDVRALAGREGAGRLAARPWTSLGAGLALFVRTLLLALVGAVYVVALLNHISYLYVLNQFRGVSVLHVLPIALVAMYALFFHGAETFGQVLGNVRRFFLANIKVAWVAAAGAIGAVMLYYLSRTGNEGVVLPFDRAFRAFLEDAFGVRPRTKELLTQPLLIMAFYLFLRHRGQARGWLLALATAGTMGILSPVDTFAHLHTPLAISALRTLYAALVSVGIGLVYAGVWELAARGWKRWRRSLPSFE